MTGHSLLPKINNLHRGKRLPRGPAREDTVSKLSLFDIVVGLNGGRRGSENEGDPLIPAPYNRHIPGMVEKPFLLFKGGIVFFIDNDESKAFNRGKNGGTDPYNHHRGDLMQEKPLAPSFPSGKAAMPAHHRDPETRADTGDELWR